MSGSARLEGFVRSRGVRLALALVLIAVGAWAFLPYFTNRVASSAFVNAELMRISSPMAGRLTREMPHKGRYLDKATSITLIQALSSDRRHLLDLDRQHAMATERADLAERQLAEIASSDRELERRATGYRDGMMRRINHEIDEIEAEKTGCLAEVRQRREVGARMEQLARSGTASQIRSAEALASQEAASTRCDMADARLHRLRGELDAAQQGIFLRDGANDVPYSQQQRDRLALRRQELESELLQERSRASQLAAEVKEERERVDRMGQFTLALPASHVVWSVAASPGSTVTEGQTVLDLADCGQRFIVVELPERDFEQIKAGNAAAVRLVGSTVWRTGMVRQVRGSAARMDDRLLAAQVPRPGAGSVTVEIGLTNEEDAADRTNFCNIGRLAEVRFPRDRFGALDRVGRFLGLTPDTPVASR